MADVYSDPAYRGAYDAFFEAGQSIVGVAGCYMSPHVLMRPAVFPDGNKWCALYGENIQDGVCGFGDTPALACAAFDISWHNGRLKLREASHV